MAKLRMAHAWRTQAAWANYFTHGSFPEVGQKQKTEKKEEGKRDWANINRNLKETIPRKANNINDLSD